MKIIVVNGFPESGKTYMEDYCINKLNKNPKYSGKVFRISTIDSVKEVAKTVGWGGDKTPNSRRFLSELKRILVEYNDYPYKTVKKKIINKIYKDGDGNDENYIFFIDSREPEEIKRFSKDMKATTVCVRRPAVEDNYHSNESDKNVLNFKYDLYLWNNKTIEDFEKNIDVFIEEITNE